MFEIHDVAGQVAQRAHSPIDDMAIDRLSYMLADRLKLEPEAITDWLGQFATVITDVQNCRDVLRYQSQNLDSEVLLGAFEPSQQIKEKIKARLSGDAGGFAWSVNSVVLGLSEIHEKLRLSLQDHLNADFSSSQVFGKIGDSNVMYQAGDAANS